VGARRSIAVGRHDEADHGLWIPRGHSGGAGALPPARAFAVAAAVLPSGADDRR